VLLNLGWQKLSRYSVEILVLFCGCVTAHSCHRKTVASYAPRKKVKVTLKQAYRTQRRSSCIVLLYFNLGTRWGWVVNTTPQALYPRNGPGPIIQEARCTLSRSERVRKNSLPLGFDPRNVQPIASRYSDYAQDRLETNVNSNLCNKTSKCTYIQHFVSHITNYQYVSIAFAIIIIRMALKGP
jgi:hypothetical protein